MYGLPQPAMHMVIRQVFSVEILAGLHFHTSVPIRGTDPLRGGLAVEDAGVVFRGILDA